MARNLIGEMCQSDGPEDDHNYGFGDYRALSALVGHLSIQWSLFESQLDNWSLLIFSDAGGETLADELNGKRVLPREYSRKTRFLRECFTTLTPLKPFEPDGIRILDRATPLSDLRHDLIHSCIVDMHAVNGRFTFRMTKTKGDTQESRIWTFNAYRFPKLEKAYSDLVGDSSEMSLRLLNHFRPR